MGHWRVDILCIVDRGLCGILESGYSVNWREEFVCDIGEWI